MMRDPVVLALLCAEQLRRYNTAPMGVKSQYLELAVESAIEAGIARDDSDEFNRAALNALSHSVLWGQLVDECVEATGTRWPSRAEVAELLAKAIEPHLEKMNRHSNAMQPILRRCDPTRMAFIVLEPYDLK